MSNDPFTEADLLRALEAANNYLEEAENVLWTASNQAESDEYAAELEALTRNVWDVQHELLDLQRKVE